MSNTMLFILLMILYIGFIVLVIYLWVQINSTDSRLTKYIESRIKLSRLDDLDDEIIEEE